MGLFDRVEKRPGTGGQRCLRQGVQVRGPAGRARLGHPPGHGRPGHRDGPRPHDGAEHLRASSSARPTTSGWPSTRTSCPTSWSPPPPSTRTPTPTSPAGALQVTFSEDEELETGVFRVRPATVQAGRRSSCTPLTPAPATARPRGSSGRGQRGRAARDARQPAPTRSHSPAARPWLVIDGERYPLIGSPDRHRPRRAGRHRPRRPGHLPAALRDPGDQRRAAPGDLCPRPRLHQRHLRQRRAHHQLHAWRKATRSPSDAPRRSSGPASGDRGAVSELTLTLLRLGLLALLWLFIFSLAAVLRTRPLRHPGVSPYRTQGTQGPTGSSRYGALCCRGSRRTGPGPRPRPPPRRARANGVDACPPCWSSPRAGWRAPRCRWAGPASSSAGPRVHPGARRRVRLRPARPDLPRAEGWFVEDLGCRNGTLANGQGRRGRPRRGRQHPADRPHHGRAAGLSPMQIALRYAARTDLGLGPKSRNEDSGYAGQHLLVLADGMGGHAAGDVASSMIVGQLAPLDAEGIGADNALTRLEQSVHEANASLHGAMDDDPELRRHGQHDRSPCCAAGNKLAMAHIGDSRAYLLRDGALSQITKDHSFVQQLLDDERITPEEAAHHPQRSLVTRVMTGQRGRRARPVDARAQGRRPLPAVLRRPVRLRPPRRHRGDPVRRPRPGADGGPAHRGRPQGRHPRQRHRRRRRCGRCRRLVGAAVPSSAPQVVGAASLRDREGRRTRGLPVSPAEKAAACCGRYGGTPVTTRRRRRTTARPWPRRPGRAGRAGDGGCSSVAVVRVVVIGVGYAAWSWTQRQYFIGSADGYVAVYQGVPQDLGPIPLSSVAQTTDIAVSSPADDLPGPGRSPHRRWTPAPTPTRGWPPSRQASESCQASAAPGHPLRGNPVVTPTPSTTTGTAGTTGTPGPTGTATSPLAPTTSPATVTASPTTARVA